MASGVFFAGQSMKNVVMSVEVKALVAPPKELNDPLDLLFRAVRGRAAGDNVLQDVTQAGSQPSAFKSAAGVLHKTLTVATGATWFSWTITVSPLVATARVISPGSRSTRV